MSGQWLRISPGIAITLKPSFCYLLLLLRQRCCIIYLLPQQHQPGSAELHSCSKEINKDCEWALRGWSVCTNFPLIYDRWAGHLYLANLLLVWILTGLRRLYQQVAVFVGRMQLFLHVLCWSGRKEASLPYMPVWPCLCFLSVMLFVCHNCQWVLKVPCIILFTGIPVMLILWGWNCCLTSASTNCLQMEVIQMRHNEEGWVPLKHAAVLQKKKLHGNAWERHHFCHAVEPHKELKASTLTVHLLV